jgi:phage protein D
MDFNLLEKKYGNFYAPGFEIEVAGKNLVREGMEITSVSIDHMLNEADHFTFTINSAFDLAAQDLKWIDYFLPAGKKVTIRMGYANTKPIMLIGIITSLTTRFPSNSTPQLVISGFDLSHLLMRGMKPRSWDDIKHSDVTSRLALQDYGLKSDVEDTKVTHPKVMKASGQSDFQFLQSLAQRNFYECYVFGETLYFRSPAVDSEPVVTLRWNHSLISFQPEINLAGQVGEVEVRGWNPKAKREIVGTASIGDELGRSSGQSGGELIQGLTRETIREHVRFPVFSQQEADLLAKSILNKHAEGLVKGRGETIGIPDILPGKRIRLEGLGKRFSKTYYIERSVHSISTSGYQTTFHIKENAI